MSSLLNLCRKRDTKTRWNVNHFVRKYAHTASPWRELGLGLDYGSASPLLKRAKMRQGGVQKYAGDRHGSGWSRSPLSPQKAAGSFP